MANDTAKTQTTNIVPVQGIFGPLPPYPCITLIGPAGEYFYAPTNPNLDGVSITNSTINSTTIGATTPSTGVFTNIATTTGTITAVPSGPTSLVNQQYVDAVAQGLSFKQPANYTTLGNITLSGLGTQANGDWASSLTAGMRILVKNQSAPAENGIYVAASSGWSRSSDANTWDELLAAYLFILEGATWGGSAWVSTIAPGGTLGVTAVTFTQFSNTALYTAGTGLTLSSYQFSITNTGVAAGAYGGASKTLSATVNAQGQLTLLSEQNIAISNSQVSGLGTMSTQNSNSVSITGGSIDGTTIGGSSAGAITGTTITANTQFSGAGTGLTGTASSLSIGGNAATATSATSATTTTNLAGGSTGSVPYQSGAGATTFVGIGSTGQVLTVAGGIPSWATPSGGTVTSVGGTGTVSGISLSGTVTSSGNLTLGGALDLSAPPTIGNATPNTISGTTVTATTKFVGPYFDAATSAGGALRNASGAAQLQWGAGGGNNLSLDVSTNINGANAQIDISPTGTGHVHIKPTGAGSIEIAPTNLGTINNMSIGATTASSGKFTTIDFSSTLAVSGSTGSAGQVLQSNGSSAPTWTTPTAYATVTDDTTTNAARYVMFANQTAGNLTTTFVASTKFQFNPSSGDLTATSFSGAGTGLTGTANSLSIGGNAATATSATSATNLAGGANGSVPYQTGSGATTFLAAGTNGYVMTLASGVPTWAAPDPAGITITDDTTTNATRYLTFTSATTGSITGENVSSTKLQFNPSTGILTATEFSGAGTGLTGTASSLSIGGNAATATSATTATNLAGGASGNVPYQTASGATTFLATGSNGQVLTLASGVPSWATPTTGTVTSVGGTGTVSGISLSGTVTSSGNLTLGGTLDLSSPPTIGNTTANTIAGTTITATTKFVGPYFDASSSAGGALRNASGAAQLQWGAGGGNNVSLDVSTNMNGTNAQIDISPTGTGHVHIKPTGSGSLEIAPTSAGTINNMSIGQTTPSTATFTNVTLNAQGDVRFADSDSSNWVAFQGAATISSNVTWTLPATDGTSGQVLSTNGSGTLSWASSGGGGGGFDAGTRMLFAQTSAPTGWTKDTTNYDNHAIRVVTGTASTGGTVNFTTAFVSQSVSGTVGGTTLTTAEMPSHTHPVGGTSPGGNAGNPNASSWSSASRNGNTSSAATGGGGSHNHSFTGTAIDLAVKYLDVITATKD